MPDLLLTLGALTLGGSAVILLFAFVTRASRARYGARWRCWIWLLLCLRLVIPVSLIPHSGESSQAPIRLSAPSDSVLYEYTPNQPGEAALPSTQGEGNRSDPSEPPPSSASQSVGGQTGTQTDDVPAAAAEKGFSISLSEVMMMIWLAGIAVFAVWTVISHVRFLRYLRRWSRPVRDPDAIRLFNQLGDQLKMDCRPNLRICAGLRAPMLAGLIHPVLLLPEEMPEGDSLRFALLHELTHFKRRDIWLKTLALLANIVHWFNPLMWYMVRLVERDTELACDEAALRRLPPEDHAAYGRTILNAVERLKVKPRS